MKKPTESEIKQKIATMGWAFALYPLTFFIPMQTQIINAITMAIFVLMCIDNKDIKKTYHKSIGWGWALLPPVYVYKRCMVLGENLTKFWLNLGLIIAGIIFEIVLMS